MKQRNIENQLVSVRTIDKYGHEYCILPSLNFLCRLLDMNMDSHCLLLFGYAWSLTHHPKNTCHEHTSLLCHLLCGKYGQGTIATAWH